MNEATDVLQAIDQLRRDLTGYHGQLKAHDDLRRHCDNQRERIVQLEGLYAEVKAENAKLRKVAGVMAYCMQAERDCDLCKVNGGAGKVTEPAGCDGLLDMLRELGIEVGK